MEKITLSFIIEEIMKAFVSFGLAFETVVTYQKSLSKMQYYFKQVGSEYYSEVLLDDYWYYVNHNGKAYSPRYLRLHKRSIALVKEYVAIGKLTWHRFCQEHGHSVFSYFQLTIDESVVKLGIPKGTLKFYISTVRQFCCKLEENGIFGLRDSGTPGLRDSGTPGLRDSGTPGHFPQKCTFSGGVGWKVVCG